MKKIRIGAIALALVLVGTVVTSCQKERTISEPTESTDTNSQAESKFFCELNDITENNYALLAQDLTGTFWGDFGKIDRYLNCGPAMEDGGDCCPPKILYLDMNGDTTSNIAEFESWGPATDPGGFPTGFDYHYLTDGLCSVSEQMDFVNRITTAANNNIPSCGGGQYQVAGYQVDWSPITDIFGNSGVAMFVRITYAPVCLTLG